MKNFQNSKMYYLIDDRNDEILYVGNTSKGLYERLNDHMKKSRETRKSLPVYASIDDWDYIDIVLIENFPCNSFKELHKREDELIDKYKPKCNRKRNHMTVEEKKTQRYNYLVDNKDKINGKRRSYAQLESSKIAKVESDAKYYERNKDKCSARAKGNYELNKEDRLNKANHYYVTNKEIINEKLKVKQHCDVCNCDVRKADFTRHTKMQKHINNLNK